MGSVDERRVARFLLGPRVKLEVCAQLFLRFLMRKAENRSGKLRLVLWYYTWSLWWFWKGVSLGLFRTCVRNYFQALIFYASG